MQSTSPRGEPRRLELDGSINRTPGNIMLMASLVTELLQVISDFWVFRHNSTSARDSMTSRSCPISAMDPPSVISSRYITQNLADKKVQWWWMDKQKRRGPRGSPCCTPFEEEMVLSPQTREDGEEYTEWTKGLMVGARISTAFNNLSLWTALKAFLKSSLTMAWSD